ncbi:nuclear polyadenylated RNA-binding protein 3 [Pleosporales sp. CAS-2024a]
MNPSPSPPQEAEHIRHQQLTPESPRPQNVPSPANIPILELQMDPNFHESSMNNGASTPAPQYASHLQPPNPYPPPPPFSDASTAANHAHGGAQGAGGAASGYAPSAAAAAHDNAYAAQQAPAQPAPGAQYQPEANGATSVDVQALLDSLTPSLQYAASQMNPQSTVPQPGASASQAGLPPKPPAQEQPAVHPNYSPNDDIRSFHPHSHQSPSTQQHAGNGQPHHPTVPGQGYAALSQGGAQSPTAKGAAPKRQPGQRSQTPDDEDVRWPPEINKKYEEFLDQERKFVTEGQWDQFPLGSRLFIGNLPTEKVTKRDIFHRFYRHGKLAQISIKQAYGFVQFLDSESCRRALDAEQGQAVRGRKMHLEISKPQKNSRKAEPQNTAPRRRSRSPDYTRGGTASARDGRYGGNQGPMSPRDRDRRFRDRDDYRPMRSPSPRGAPRGMRSRDRSRDRFDNRYRSRSRTPPRRRRSPSPRQDYTEDDLDLRRRLPHEVPDIQILVLHEGISRDFIRYVEDIFRQQGLRSNVLIMSGRFPEPAVVRRQIIEGVLAIVRMDTSGFIKGKVSVQIFDRRGGANNVQFNEYADLDPTTAALLVNNTKQTQSQPVQPSAPAFGFNSNMPPFNQSAPNPFTTAPASQPNISNIITSLDSASLSQLLGAMSASNNVPQSQQPAPMFNADIARLLAQVSSPTQTPGFGAPVPPQMSQLNQFPGLAAMLASQAPPAAPPVQNPPQTGNPPPDMSEIMAQLAQYQRG